MVAPVSLPNLSADPNARARRIASIRRRYRYEENNHRAFALAGNLPLNEAFDAKYLGLLGKMYIRAYKLTARGRTLHARAKLTGRLDLKRLYERIAEPVVSRELLETYDDDAEFARQRLSGNNPVNIRRLRSVAELPSGFPLDDPRLGRHSMSGRSLAEEIEAGKVFVDNYNFLRAALRPQTPTDSRWRDTYMPAPIVLYVWRPGDDARCELVPIAIQVDQDHDPTDNPLHTPAEPAAWALARFYVGVADMCAQQWVHHFFRAELSQLPFAVSTPRCLAPEHPVSVLLRPHLQFTLAINYAIWRAAFGPGALAHTLVGGSEATHFQITTDATGWLPFHARALEADLRARGVDEAPSEYPYRDDARLWWRAILRYVATYLELFYADDAAVTADVELAAWVEELESPDGGRLRLFPAGERLDSRERLADLLTQIIFTAGPYHAALHYPELEFMRLIPCFPGVANAPPPRGQFSWSRAHLQRALPRFSLGLLQFSTASKADLRYDTFGDYGGFCIDELPAARPVVAQLRRDLMEIEQTIRRRNELRAMPYEYLLPSRVPNSIHI